MSNQVFRANWIQGLAALGVLALVSACGSDSVGGDDLSNGDSGSASTPNGGQTGNNGGSGNGGNTGNNGGNGNGAGSGGINPSGGNGGGGEVLPPACMPESSNIAAKLPTKFFQSCGGCHSAFGTSANPAVPNLFNFASKPQGGDASAFVAQVRTPEAGKLMPAFPEGMISDADIQQIYDYFKEGAPTTAITCPGPDGTESANLGSCSGQALAYTPLFPPTEDTLPPISYVDPDTGHLIFRGAGRVRFRHEMEDSFAVYHDHYFEGRTFEYILEDTIPAGGSTIKVTFLPNSNQYFSEQGVEQQGGADLNIRWWKEYGGIHGNTYSGNAGGASKDVLPMGCDGDANGPTCNTKHYEFTIKRNERENRPIQMGDQLQVEFGIFMARYGTGEGPPFDFSHVRNNMPLPDGCTLNGPPFDNKCYTQANYYSDSFRYVVGKGFLSPYNEDCTMSVPVERENDFPTPYDCSPNGPVAQAIQAGEFPERMGPDEAGWSAGTATLSYLRQRHDMYYSQMAPNILGENVEDFNQGRRLFHLDYTTGKHRELNNDVSPAETELHANLAGPFLNQRACESCHIHNNRGFPPPEGQSFESMVVKLSGNGTDEHGGPTPDPKYGKQLQNVAIGAIPEGSAKFQYETVNGTFKDGTAYTLKKPTAVFNDLSSGDPVAYSVRLARPMIGMGLLEAIPEADILAHADPTDCDQDGIKGVPNLVFDPESKKMKIGRFGWKASKVSVRHQAAEAAMLDIGVTTSIFPGNDCGPEQANCDPTPMATPELSDEDLDLIVTYVRDLGVPPRRDLNDPKVIRGEEVFAQVGCVNCHAPNQHTGNTSPFLEMRNQVIHPYSDLLLHDLGPDLADNSQGEYAATSTMWRTPPLWGIGLCDEVAKGYQADNTMNPAPDMGTCSYLHDGRAASLLEAILWHGGEAAAVKEKVLDLSSADRDALITFLKSL